MAGREQDKYYNKYWDVNLFSLACRFPLEMCLFHTGMRCRFPPRSGSLGLYLKVIIVTA